MLDIAGGAHVGTRREEAPGPVGVMVGGRTPSASQAAKQRLDGACADSVYDHRFVEEIGTAWRFPEDVLHGQILDSVIFRRSGSSALM